MQDDFRWKGCVGETRVGVVAQGDDLGLPKAKRRGSWRYAWELATAIFRAMAEELAEKNKSIVALRAEILEYVAAREEDTRRMEYGGLDTWIGDCRVVKSGGVWVVSSADGRLSFHSRIRTAFQAAEEINAGIRILSEGETGNGQELS